jgi:21S rRNA (GM2251-2'-O)-methyltransferase
MAATAGRCLLRGGALRRCSHAGAGLAAGAAPAPATGRAALHSAPTPAAAWGAPGPGGPTRNARAGSSGAGRPSSGRGVPAAGGGGERDAAGAVPAWAAPDRRADADPDAGGGWARSSASRRSSQNSSSRGGGGRDGWRQGGGGGGGGGGGNRSRYRAPPSGAALAAERRLGPGLVALYGVNPVAAALASGRRVADALYVQAGAGEGGGGGGGGGGTTATPASDLARVAARGGGGGRAGAPSRGAAARARLAAAATAAAIPVHWVDKHELNLMTDGAPHQGVVLAAAPLAWPRLAGLPAPADAAAAAAAAAASPPGPSSPPVWLALDEVCDPQNLGAILRSAHFLGAAGVLLSPTNCAPPSPAVSKASAGALEWVAVHAASRPLPAVLRAAAEAGWDVVGAASSSGRRGADAGVGGAASPGPGGRPATTRPPTVLVLGSEGGGLRPAVAAACGRFISVERGGDGPGLGSGPGAVDSLNVSAAAAVLLHRLVAR